jgi:hypothetical protein
MRIGFLLTSLMLAVVPATAVAQQNIIELLRTDVSAQAQALMDAGMQLPETEATTFWPIYREYGLERSQWGDRRLALIKSYADKYETLTEQDAKQLGEEWFKVQEDRLKLWKKYYQRVSKNVSPSVAARFIQIESQINMLIDIQIAQEIPLVFTTDM